ncbi:hypothetical protein PABG_02420 [Paracoccidioides brasiliensis Pb03]|nr:hypothetical protein PABG_02420 [Paracoccidioides brasiliensis Pb03]
MSEYIKLPKGKHQISAPVQKANSPVLFARVGRDLGKVSGRHRNSSCIQHAERRSGTQHSIP